MRESGVASRTQNSSEQEIDSSSGRTDRQDTVEDDLIDSGIDTQTGKRYPAPCNGQENCKFDGHSFILVEGEGGDQFLGEVVIAKGKYYIYKATSRDSFSSIRSYLDEDGSQFKPQKPMGHGMNLKDIPRFQRVCAKSKEELKSDNCGISFISYHQTKWGLFETVGVGKYFFNNIVEIGYWDVKREGVPLFRWTNKGHDSARGATYGSVKESNGDYGRYYVACFQQPFDFPACALDTRTVIERKDSIVDSFTIDGYYFNFERKLSEEFFTAWQVSEGRIYGKLHEVTRYKSSRSSNKAPCEDEAKANKMCHFDSRFVIQLDTKNYDDFELREIIIKGDTLYYLHPKFSFPDRYGDSTVAGMTAGVENLKDIKRFFSDVGDKIN